MSFTEVLRKWIYIGQWTSGAPFDQRSLVIKLSCPKLHNAIEILSRQVLKEVDFEGNTAYSY